MNSNARSARADVVHRNAHRLPILAAAIRVAGRTETEGRAWEIVRTLTAALSQFADPVGNELIPRANDGYADDTHASDVLARASRRTGMLLNAQERGLPLRPLDENLLAALQAEACACEPSRQASRWIARKMSSAPFD